VIETDGQTRAPLLMIAVGVFALEYNLYLVTDDLPDKLIKLSAACFMLLCLRYRPRETPSGERSLLWLYYGLLLTALMPSFLVGNVLTGVVQWMKIALETLVLPVLLLDHNLRERGARQLLSLYVAVGVLFSLQGIAAFFGVLWNFLDTSVMIDIGRRPDLTENTLGVFGYADALKYPMDLVWLRPQGWFVEPSLLGAFLLLPAFASLGRFLEHGRVRFLLAFLIILGALFLTVSMAAYLGFVVGMLFLVFSRPLYRALSRIASPLKYAYPVPIVAGFLALALAAIGLVNGMADLNLAGPHADPNQALIAGIYARDPTGDSGNLFREVASTDMFLATFASNPLGIGFAATEGTSDILAANGILFWAITGGLPALLVLTALFTHIFLAFCHPLLVSDSVLHRCLAGSLLGHAVHNLSFGNWTAPFFLVHLAIVCMAGRALRSTNPASAAVGATILPAQRQTTGRFGNDR
jgi:hypothetical protein